MRVQREGQDYESWLCRVSRDKEAGKGKYREWLRVLGNARGHSIGTAFLQLLGRKRISPPDPSILRRSEIELMDRLAFSEDKARLSFSLEVSSGGKTVRYKDDFPVTLPK
jgi:hypothetical protein